MRLVFNRCHGENPCGPAEGGGPCEFVDLESFINQSCKIRYSRVHPSSSRATAPKLNKTEKRNACRPTPSRSKRPGRRCGKPITSGAVYFGRSGAKTQRRMSGCHLPYDEPVTVSNRFSRTTLTAASRSCWN